MGLKDPHISDQLLQTNLKIAHRSVRSLFQNLSRFKGVVYLYIDLGGAKITKEKIIVNISEGTIAIHTGRPDMPSKMIHYYKTRYVKP